MTERWDDEEELEEHLEAVKPAPSDQDELDELVEPSTELGTAQDGEQASVDDAMGECECAGGVESSSSSDGLDVLVESSVELRTVQEQEAADEDGGDCDE